MNNELDFYKRYERFKSHSLPTPVWDEERKILEYVYYDNSVLEAEGESVDTGVRVDTNIVESLGDIIYMNLFYTFTSKYFTKDSESSEYKTEIGKSHAHSFQEVVRNLYDFPESFRITKEDVSCYSRQQLEYLRRLQKYLTFLGLKDIESYKINQERYQNVLQHRYNKAFIYEYSLESIQDFKSHKRNFIVNEYNERYHSEGEKEVDYYALITDEKSNFHLYVHFNLRKIVDYKSIKEVYTDPTNTLKDEDRVVITYFDILDTFND